MRPPAAASELAAAALARLDPPARARAALPARIAAGADLVPSEVATVRSFWADPPRPADPAWVLASSLLGGRPLNRAAAATAEEAAGGPDPGPHSGAMLALSFPAPVTAGLAVPGGLPADDLHVTLVYLGDPAELDPLALIEADAVAAELAAGWPAPVVEFTHVGHLGDDPEVAAVALEGYAPALHEFRRALVQALTAAGVPWSDRWAFRPHLTLTYLPADEASAEWPAGPLPEHVSVAPDGVLRAFGPDRVVYPFGGPVAAAGRVSVAAAAAPPGFPLLSALLAGLNNDLETLDTVLAAEIGTAVDLGFRSALDRVGRMATREASAADRARIIELDPAVVAAAPHVDLAGLNVAALVAPAVDDVARFVASTVGRAHAEISALIGEAFGVDFTTDPYAGNIERAASMATRGLRAELDYRLGVTTLDRIDPVTPTDLLAPPWQITRDVLAVAGGADLGHDLRPLRDGAGRPLGNGVAGADGVALGPRSVALIDEAIAAYLDAPPEPAPRGPFLAAARRRPAGARISDALRGELAEAAERVKPGAKSPLQRVTVNVWKLNMNGRAKQNLPAHVKMAGTTITTPAELYGVESGAADPTEWPFVGHRFPGDHPHCHCGWKTEVRLVPRQGALDV